MSKHIKIQVPENNNTQTPGINNNQNTGNTNTQIPGNSEPTVKTGDIFELKGLCYQITKIDGKHSTVALIKTNNKSIKKLTVPKTVKYNGVTYKVTAIADKAFQNCKKLKAVVIGKNVTAIGKAAFKGCKNLKTVTIKSKELGKVGQRHLGVSNHLQRLNVEVVR